MAPLRWAAPQDSVGLVREWPILELLMTCTRSLTRGPVTPTLPSTGPIPHGSEEIPLNPWRGGSP